MSLPIRIAESGWAPDFMVRAGIRALLRGRLAQEKRNQEGLADGSFEAVMRQGPIAVATNEANEQHYELPPRFFELVLGPNLKYSSCLWEKGVERLGQAEESMLATSCERAQLDNGQEILELGCGWGSLTLWMARRYPTSRILAVSNSKDQRRFIEGRCREAGLENVEVRTADMNHFDTSRRFDRVVSIEMFEHMRNYRLLLSRVAGWLREEGRLFIHIFCHRATPYFFELDGDNDWMARYFFTGGLMPSFDLLRSFDDDLEVEAQWAVNGDHYCRTSEAWLKNLDRNQPEIKRLFRETYGPREASLWLHRWRLFFLACAELFGFRGGEEWLVGHYLLRHKPGHGSGGAA